MFHEQKESVRNQTVNNALFLDFFRTFGVLSGRLSTWSNSHFIVCFIFLLNNQASDNLMMSQIAKLLKILT